MLLKDRSIYSSALTIAGSGLTVVAVWALKAHHDQLVFSSFAWGAFLLRLGVVLHHESASGQQ